MRTIAILALARHKEDATSLDLQEPSVPPEPKKSCITQKLQLKLLE
jgi:hypothetical protein